ncbi:MAG: hypothetical protein KC478_14560 [Bacteriovoracaceae bacterium]|nr:hypothetical protein [Bacteriovoracaceae bacterium]
MFLFESSFEATDTIPLQLEIAKWTAPISLATAIIEGVVNLADVKKQQLTTFFSRDNIITIGSGSIGISLANSLSQLGRKVVVIEDVDVNHDVEIRKHKNLKHIKINLGDTDFAWLGLQTGCEILIDRKNDSESIKNAMELFELYKAKGLKSQVKCFVSLENVLNGDFLLKNKILEYKGFTFKTFNKYKLGARSLVNFYSPDALIKGFNYQSKKVVLSGFSSLSFELLEQLLTLPTSLQMRTDEYLVLYADGQKDIVDKFVRKFPLISKVADVKFVNINIHDLNQVKMNPYSDFFKDENSINYISYEEDQDCLICYEFFKRYYMNSRPKVICLQGNSILNEKIMSEGISKGNASYIFDLANIEPDIVLEEKLDRLAKVRHQEYVEFYLSLGEKLGSRVNLNPWEEVPEEVKQSSRNFVDHLAIKARFSKFLEENGQDTQLLIKFEHSRWLADSFLLHWEYSEERDDERRLHPGITEFENIREKEFEYFKKNIELSKKLISQYSL